jgi:anti-anti-sigma factor
VREHGLHRYLRLVARELRLEGESWSVHQEPGFSVYLPLQERSERFPDQDVALLWDERFGWAAAVESSRDNELTVLGYLGQDVLPSPRTVARFATEVIAGDGDARPRPANPPRPDDLADRLGRYATPSASVTLTVHTDRPLQPMVVEATGELDMITSSQLSDAVTEALARQPRILVIDLTEVRFIGSGGIGVLVRAHREASEHTSVRVVTGASSVRRPLELTGLISTLRVYRSLEEALAPDTGDATTG